MTIMTLWQAAGRIEELERELTAKAAEVEKLKGERDEALCKLASICAHHCESDGCAISDQPEPQVVAFYQRFHAYKKRAETAESALLEARRNALEEAARVAEGWKRGKHIAGRIRALISGGTT